MTKGRKPNKGSEPARQGAFFPPAPANVLQLVKDMAAEMQLRKLTREGVASDLGTVEGALKAWFEGSAVPGPEFQERIKHWLGQHK